MKNVSSQQVSNQAVKEGAGDVFEFYLGEEELDIDRGSTHGGANFHLKHRETPGDFTDYRAFCSILDTRYNIDNIEISKLEELKNGIAKIKELMGLISRIDSLSPIVFFSSPNNRHSTKDDRSEALRSHKLMHDGYEYYIKGQYYQACILYKEALDIRQNNSAKSNHIADSYNNLGVCYHKLGLLDDALYCHRHALDMRMIISRSANYDLKIAESYGNLGAVLLDMEDLDTALKCFLNAVHIRKVINKDNHYCSEMVVSYNQFGAISFAKGDYDFAETFFDTALRINLSISKSNIYNLGVATNFKNLAILNLKIGKQEYSKKCFLAVLEILHKLYDQDEGESDNFLSHPDVVYTYCNLAAISLDNQEYESGLEYLRKVLTIYQFASETNAYNTAMSYPFYDILLRDFDKDDYSDKSYDKWPNNTQSLTRGTSLATENKHNGDIYFIWQSSRQDECISLLLSLHESLTKTGAALSAEFALEQSRLLESIFLGYDPLDYSDVYSFSS